MAWIYYAQACYSIIQKMSLMKTLHTLQKKPGQTARALFKYKIKKLSMSLNYPN